jgi:hypothetical protein
VPLVERVRRPATLSRPNLALKPGYPLAGADE